MGKIPRQGDYLTSDDVNEGDTLTIIEEPQLRSKEETGFDRDVWGIKVELPNKSQKLWTLNKTTYNALWDTYGDESKDWIGKKVQISIEKRKVRGETRTIIYGDPVEPAQQPPEREAPTPRDTQQLAQTLKKMTPEQRNAYLDNLARESGAYEQPQK